MTDKHELDPSVEEKKIGAVRDVDIEAETDEVLNQRYKDWVKKQDIQNSIAEELQEEIDKRRDEKVMNDDKAMLPGGGISFHQFKKPDARILKTFDSPNQKQSFTVVFSTTELTALCPLTGMPDYYTLKIEYTPDKKCVESKSAKFYFHSFRDAGMFIETLTNKIADDWEEVCAPRCLKVTNTMNPRGGIPITVMIERHRIVC